MRKLLAALILCLLPWPAQAQLGCSVPFNLQNNTTADATQVMANFNAITNCVNLNAAKNGVNADITQLSALTVAITSAQGGTNIYVATATSTGSANAQVIAATSPTFSLSIGKRVQFVAGFTNTGPTQINVSSTGLINVFRLAPGGPVALGGGEIIAGQFVEAIYDGTQWQLTTNASPLPPGTIIDYGGTSCPTGFQIASGVAISAASNPTINTILGTTWGTSGGNVVMPDLRNRATFGQDVNQGGFAARITVAGGNFDGTIVGGGGGVQNRVIAAGNLPASLPYTDPGHTHTIGVNQVKSSPTVGGTDMSNSGANVKYSDTAVVVPSNTTGITINPGSANTALITLSPAAIVSKCVRL